MDREFSAPLHHTQFGNHLQYKTRAWIVFDYQANTPKGEWV